MAQEGIWLWNSVNSLWVKALCDSSGHLQVDVLSAPLPTDAATETTLGLIKTAAEVIDNFISGARGLVTEDNSASILAKFVPLAKAAQHGVAETADTDILAADLSPTNTPCLFRTMVMLDTAGVFSAMLKNGGTTKTLKLNGATALTASCAYMFDILVHSGDTVNFQTSVSGNVTLRVQEIVGGVQ